MYKNFVKYNRHTRDSSIIKKELVQRLYKKRCKQFTPRVREKKC